MLKSEELKGGSGREGLREKINQMREAIANMKESKQEMFITEESEVEKKQKK
jgi:hypothetical protein